ncbi:hypothetical protein GGR54DRAFT_643897 [Hypoxylon sp. NC1633]|nr:hypothetical protein GGR54DRAFT_643897 [Hypoxylon sp. NC1633]
MTTAHFLSYPPRPVDGKPVDKESRPLEVLIYLISGNPGLVDYYAPFLSALRGLIDELHSLRHVRFYIYGQDLAGFRDDDHAPFTAHRKPYDLEHQIRYTLGALARLHVESRQQRGLPYDEVLLIGHSVGAYIALELFHRLLRDQESEQPLQDLNLASAILLFPTISHISRSPNGWKLDLLRRTPVLGDNAYRVAQAFLRLCPRGALRWVVRRVLGFPAGGAEVTTDWLKSRDGVWQALHMGMDEMRVIGEDLWDDELWEIARDAEAHRKPVPKFFFFFGRRDNWVADHHRDEFIGKRRGQVERTELIVDEGDIPHAFCIRHSEAVAEKVTAWIKQMYAANQDDKN